MNSKIDENPPILNILIADDQESSLRVLEAVLKTFPVTLLKAYSGSEAINFAMSNTFAVILLDVQMPTMDGYETATEIRKNQLNSCTPIIFLTAQTNIAEQSLKGYAAGAVDFLQKPYNFDILKMKVKVFLELATQSILIKEQAVILAKREAENQYLAEIRQKNQELELINKELDAFSYSVSHDLRAPLRSIDAFSLILYENYADKMDNLGKKYLQYIRKSAQRMSELIEDLLKLSRVNNTSICRKPIDISKITREIVTVLQLQHTEKVPEFIIHDGLKTEGDPSLIASIVENLIDNAIKFTSNSQQPRIEVGMIKNQNEDVFFIKDNGAGFSMTQADKLFKAFHRLHSHDSYAGNGIGLTIVQRIVSRHGGRVWAEGEENIGATFFFTLPPSSPYNTKSI